MGGGSRGRLSQSVLSPQYVQVPVTAFGTAGTYNPTGDTVQFSFTPASYPVTEPSVWVTGSWVNVPRAGVLGAVPRRARNGGTALSIGTYQVWLKITDSPEVPSCSRPC